MKMKKLKIWQMLVEKFVSIDIITFNQEFIILVKKIS